MKLQEALDFVRTKTKELIKLQAQLASQSGDATPEQMVEMVAIISELEEIADAKIADISALEQLVGEEDRVDAEPASKASASSSSSASAPAPVEIKVIEGKTSKVKRLKNHIVTLIAILVVENNEIELKLIREVAKYVEMEKIGKLLLYPLAEPCPFQVDFAASPECSPEMEKLLKTGTIWHQYFKDRLENQKILIGNKPDLPEISYSNLTKIMAEIGELYEHEEIFIQTFKKLPFTMTHATDNLSGYHESGSKILSKMAFEKNAGRMLRDANSDFAPAASASSSISQEDEKTRRRFENVYLPADATIISIASTKVMPANNSPSRNIEDIGNDGCVFFRFGTETANIKSRFGKDTLIFSASSTALYQQGWISLTDMLDPVGLEFKMVKFDEHVYRISADETSEPNSKYQYPDEVTPELKGNVMHYYPHGKNKFFIDSVVEQVFYGQHILPGAALMLVREIRRMGPEFKILAEKNAGNSEWVSRIFPKLFRPEAKMPFIFKFGAQVDIKPTVITAIPPSRNDKRPKKAITVDDLEKALKKAFKGANVQADDPASSSSEPASKAGAKKGDHSAVVDDGASSSKAASKPKSKKGDKPAVADDSASSIGLPKENEM